MSRRPFARRGALAVAGAVVIAASLLAASRGDRAETVASAQGGCVKLAPALQGSISFTLDPQSPADCAGWQLFVYLNWRAGGIGEPAPVPPSDFGKPVDDPAHAETTVWESYHDAAELFSSTLPIRAVRAANAVRPQLTLGAINKYMNADLLTRTGQATGGWITAQNRLLTFYDIRVDNDEYDYVRANNLTTRAALRACAQGPAGFQLPLGNGLPVPAPPSASPGPPDVSCKGPLTGSQRWYGKGIGAIDIKAAWLDLTGAPKSVLRKYLIAQASLWYPGESAPRKNRTVGLVGMHIVRKMTGAHQWIWATFMHLDDMPSGWVSPLPSPRPGATWAYFKPSSTQRPNVGPPTPCITRARGIAFAAHASAARCTPYNVPSQLVAAVDPPRDTSLINPIAWKIMPAGSVFLNYALVSVQWTKADVPLPPGAPVPLPSNSPLPTVLGNPVLESYKQTTASCLGCHRFGSLPAPSAMPMLSASGRRLVRLVAPPTNAPVVYGADYSFIFDSVAR